MARRRGRATPMALVVVALAVVLLTVLLPRLTGTGAAPPASAPVDGQSASPGPRGGAGSALALLARLPVKGKAPYTGYDRVGDFGEAWLDVDGNGCDTRDDVLRRDLRRTRAAACKVFEGTLLDPYTNRRIDFARGADTSDAVQIDHVVALANAWRTGAQQLSRQQRERLANDPINLFAVDGPTNQAKGDADAAAWLPPNRSFRCTYIAHQVAVKAAYGLWVTPAERGAMERVLRTCPDTSAPSSSLAAG